MTETAPKRTELSRRHALGALLAGVGLATTPARALTFSPYPAARPEDFWLRGLTSAETLLRASGLAAKTSFALVDLTTGLPLETWSPNTALPPASVAKAATALYALRVLGPTHRFTTQLLAAGPISNGRLEGDLVLAGGGDPVLDTIALDRLVRLLRERGISEITGTLRVYTGALPDIRSIDPGQPDHLGYSPAISGLNLNFNRVYFEWQRKGADYAISMDARTGTLRPPVRVSSMSVKPRDLPIYTYEQRGNADHWTVARGALGTEGGRWLPVRNPASYGADVFCTLAGGLGLTLKPGESLRVLPSGMTEIARHESETLPGLLRGMLKYSTNLTAECVGLSASRALGAYPDSLAASGAQMSAWLRAQLPWSSEMQLADHSGLGDTSRISSLDMAALLAAHGTRQALSPLLKPYRLRDGSGTAVAAETLKVVAKTGTLNFVSGLAGYVTSSSGRPLAFAVFSADLDRRATLSRAQRDRPDGGRAWARRARKLQNDLVLRWSQIARA